MAEDFGCGEGGGLCVCMGGGVHTHQAVCVLVSKYNMFVCGGTVRL